MIEKFKTINAKENLDWICEKMRDRLEKYDGLFPSETGHNGFYKLGQSDDWTEGYFVGNIWLCYEHTNDKFFYDAGLRYADAMCERIDKMFKLNHHDLGFLFGLSLVPAYEFSKEKKYLDYIVTICDHFISRYHEKGQFIQSWGLIGDLNEYRAIIDSLNNMPFLYRATELTGDKKYAEIATLHYNTSVSNHLRANGTTYHTFFFNPEDGSPLRGQTAQGHRDESTWARGQAWGISGIPMNYAHNKIDYSDKFYALLKVFNENVPSDGVVYWDFDFTDENPSSKDSSSNVIAACGCLEMLRHETDSAKIELLEYTILKLVVSINDKYIVKGNESDVFVDLGVQNMNNNQGIDEGSLWGDYYYTEALTRILKPDWKSYW